jgi:hypothetical protein
VLLVSGHARMVARAQSRRAVLSCKQSCMMMFHPTLIATWRACSEVSEHQCNASLWLLEANSKRKLQGLYYEDPDDYPFQEGLILLRQLIP